jgi:hypothetical protein
MRDAMILIQDHDSIIRLLQRGQQDVGTFYYRPVVHGHQGIDPANARSGKAHRGFPKDHAPTKGTPCSWKSVSPQG